MGVVIPGSDRGAAEQRRPRTRFLAPLAALVVVPGQLVGAGATFFEPYSCDGAATLAATWTVDQQTWCCAEKGKGCNQHFDCEVGYSRWRTAWSYAQKLYCCREKRRGCVAVSEDPAPTPAPPPPPPPPKPAGCDTECVAYGVSHSCMKRVAWSATNMFQAKPDPCKESMDLIVSQCPECSSCRVEDSGCVNPAAQPPVNAPPAVDPVQARLERLEKEKAALEAKLAAAATKTYDCHAGTLASMQSWDAEKKRYCCKAQHRACDLIGNRSPPQTHNADKPYRCTGDGAGAKDAWSDVKLEWCCQYEKVGCQAHHQPPAQPPAQPQAQPAQPAQQLAAPAGGAGVFDGKWTDKRGNSLVIQGSTITWPTTHREAKITKMSSKGITMSFANGNYHAKNVGGKLVWDVDDVWSRVPGPAPAAPSTTAPPTTAPAAPAAPAATTAAPALESSRDKVRKVLSTIDRNKDGHLNFDEITFLQKAAHVGHIKRSTYEQLCQQFGEDADVGLGVETLASIYSRTGKLASPEASIAEKFLSMEMELEAAAAPRIAVPPAFALMALAGAVSAAGAARLAKRRRPARTTSQLLEVGSLTDDAGEEFAAHFSRTELLAERAA